MRSSSRLGRSIPWIAALLPLAVLACSARNPDYCDEGTACGEGQTCDLARNRCVVGAPAECAGPADCLDPAAPLCIDGACGQCLSAADCSSEAPRCSGAPDHLCLGCAVSEDCASHGDALVCAPGGACVGCAGEADCPAGDACDATLGECRPCAANGDCESRVCQVEAGACVSAVQVVYVSPSGVDQPGCALGAPCATIGFALSHVAAGRPYLHLAAGALTENLDLVDLRASIVAEPGAELRGADPDRPVLRLAGGEITIEGLEVVGRADGASAGIQIDGGVHHLREVVARGAGGSGLTVTGGEVVFTGGRAIENAAHGFLVEAGRAAIARARLGENGGAGLVITGGEAALEATTIARNRDGGLFARNAEVEVVNCFVHHNTSTDLAPVHFASSLSGSARVVHTTIVANLSGADETSGVLCGSVDDVTLRNDIIQGNQGPSAPVAGCAVTYSLLGPAIAPGIGNVLGTPRFVDLDGGDLHLVPDSVGVDDGTSGDAEVDADGDARPAGAAPDMGADEVTARDAMAAERPRQGRQEPRR